ncbi:hypothetical protein [Klebsiella quasipneumoniae]|uniref:hypothetical protein n=1 Tax=Klebsiella quasipneumoniae TaxID=1463165 RepID=UPI00388FAA2D
MLALVKIMWQSMIAAASGERQLIKNNAKLVFTCFPAICFIISPFILSFISGEGIYTVKTLSQLSVASQWLGFISSLVMVIVFSFYSERGKKFWNTGCAVLSLILAFIFLTVQCSIPVRMVPLIRYLFSPFPRMSSVNVEWSFLNTKKAMNLNGAVLHQLQ